MNASFFRGPLGLVTLGLVSVTTAALLLLPAVGQAYPEAPNDWIGDDAGDGGGGAWRLLGNAGTNPVTNFVGTTDFTPLTISTATSPRIHILADGEVQVSEDMIMVDGTAADQNDLTLGAFNSLFMPFGSWDGFGTGHLNLFMGDMNVDDGDLNMQEGSWNGTTTFDLTLTMGNANLDAGDVNVDAGDVNVDAGDVNVDVGDVNVTAGNVNVDAGDVNVMAGNLNMPFGTWDGTTGTVTTEVPAGFGPGGNVFVSPPADPTADPGGNVVIGTVPATVFGQSSHLLVTDGFVGIGDLNPDLPVTDDGIPAAHLHVEGIGSYEGDYEHLAVFRSRKNPADPDSTPDGIAIELEVTGAATLADNNFITFFEIGNGTSFGAINREVDGNGDTVVSYQSALGADFAEGLPKLVPGENIEPGMIVGVYGGYVTKDTVGADHVMVISTAPAFLGNAPPANEQHNYGIVTFMGRVPVLVRAPVSSGDFIVASGMADGTAIGVNPADLGLEEMGDVVGRAWSNLEGGLLGYVDVVVGVNSAVGVAEALPAQIARVQELQAALDHTQSQLAAMSARLAQLEAAIGD